MAASSVLSFWCALAAQIPPDFIGGPDCNGLIDPANYVELGEWET
jgi:hypothetical protein